jgi:hypothetical protein
MRVYRLKVGLILLTMASASFSAAQSIHGGGAVAPLYRQGLQNQFYIGYERSEYDYGLVTNSGVMRVATNGINAQIAYREREHLVILGTARYGLGSPLNETMTTVGAGAGYVTYWKRYEPFVQGMVGYSRLSSSDNIYLSDRPISGFTTLFGGGLDVALSGHWGIRPIYVENQYLPFGPHGSTYWNIESGILLRFSSFCITPKSR